MDADFPAGMVAEIETFLQEDRARPPGLNIYEDVFKTSHFFPLQRQAELRRMVQIARSIEPNVVMEIGSDKGGSLYHWCKCLPSVSAVIACEMRGCPYQRLFSRAFPKIQFCWMERASLPPPYVKPGTIDVLFIDGDKSGFLADFDAYLPLMNPDGLVFLHDVQDDYSRKAFEAIGRRGYRTEVVVDVSDYEAAAERERAGVPVSSPHEAWLRFWKGRSCGVGVVWLRK